jgi:hypothetical protein
LPLLSHNFVFAAVSLFQHFLIYNLNVNKFGITTQTTITFKAVINSIKRLN